MQFGLCRTATNFIPCLPSFWRIRKRPAPWGSVGAVSLKSSRGRQAGRLRRSSRHCRWEPRREFAEAMGVAAAAALSSAHCGERSLARKAEEVAMAGDKCGVDLGGGGGEDAGGDWAKKKSRGAGGG